MSSSLVSGHLGGANELCRRAAEKLGAVPVITTATDLNRQFAVDVFAKKNGLQIHSMEAAKMISARLLEGDRVAFESCLALEGETAAGALLETGKKGGRLEHFSGSVPRRGKGKNVCF